MKSAKDVETAKERAEIAIDLLKTTKPWREGGKGLSRGFDDCFEMGDGDDVYRIVITKAAHHPSLLSAIERHGYDSWAKQVKDPDNHWIWVAGTIQWEAHPHGPESSLEEAMEFAEREMCAPWMVVNSTGKPVAYGDANGRHYPGEQVG